MKKNILILISLFLTFGIIFANWNSEVVSNKVSYTADTTITSSDFSISDAKYCYLMTSLTGTGSAKVKIQGKVGNNWIDVLAYSSTFTQKQICLRHPDTNSVTTGQFRIVTDVDNQAGTVILSQQLSYWK